MADNPQSNVQGDVPNNLANIIIAGENGYFGSQAIKYGAKPAAQLGGSALLILVVVGLGLFLYLRK